MNVLLTHIRGLCVVRERREVGTGEGKRHEWEVHLSNFTMNLFTIYTPTIVDEWE